MMFDPYDSDLSESEHVHVYLDNQGIPRRNEFGREYHLLNRVRIFVEQQKVPDCQDENSSNIWGWFVFIVGGILALIYLIMQNDKK
jgi:hypothetical protein